jgi:hypothetical protein
MKFFNDIVDIGDHIDPWLMSALNTLVLVHLLAFFVMIILIAWSWSRTPEDAFKKEVERLSKEAHDEVLNKKKQ